MASKPKPAHQQAMVFVKYHLGDKHCFAPFTGQDWPAWIAFCYLLQCWGSGGGHAAIRALRETLCCAQAKTDVMQIFVQTIPAMLDWGHVEEIWSQLLPDNPHREIGMGLEAIQRNDSPTAERGTS